MFSVIFGFRAQSRLTCLAALAMVFGLTACEGKRAPTPAETADAWNRTFLNADGSATLIPTKPRRILSTSPSITGTLLAIDAPVVASVSAANGAFFAQWAGVAKARRVQNAWSAGGVDLEIARATRPDLIVVSMGGADSAREHLAELRAIAPTIVLDYGGQSWQSLAVKLGQATGLETKAAARIAQFDTHVAAARERITPPKGEVNIISYNGPGARNPIATADGAHGRLLTAMGFKVEDPDRRWHSTAEAPSDFVWAPYENLVRLRADTTFLVRGGDDRAEAFLNDPVLANLPSVRGRRVVALGANSFRIDYYSATEIVDRLTREFGR